MTRTLKDLVLEIVNSQPGKKASEMVSLARPAGMSPSRSEINSALYTMKKDGLVEKDQSHRWWPKAESRTSTAARDTPSGGPDSRAATHPVYRTIILTDEQKRLVSIAPTGHTLIRGEPGSGKTTVLAHRARELADKGSAGTLLMLTYNTALSAYVRSLLTSMGSQDVAVISTLHNWVSDACKEMSGARCNWVRNDQLGRIIEQALKEERACRDAHRLLELNASFWNEEIIWIYGQGIGSREVYVDAVRAGRGTAVQIRGEDRNVAWAVFERVHRALKSAGVVHMDNAIGPLLTAIRDADGRIMAGLQYDHVFVDEVQDFHAAWLMMMSRIAKTSLTLAGDLGQRIYRRSFTWKSVGINVVGRSHSLKGSFRTTHQIMSVAVQLLKGMELAKDADWVPPTLPSRNGPNVKVVVRASEQQLYDEAANRAAGILKAFPDASIVIAHHFNRPLNEIVARVSQRVPRTRKAKGSELGAMPPGVLVTTYFQLKGLEFDHVILVGLEDRLIPSWWVAKRDETETEQEAEEYLRRLVYVAMTRARNSVHLMAKGTLSRFFDQVDRSITDWE